MPLPESPIKTLGKDQCVCASVYFNPADEKYFSRQLVLDHGWRQLIIPQLLAKFHEACEAAGLKVYDLDIHEKVAEVLTKINFNEPNTTKTERPPAKRVVKEQRPVGEAKPSSPIA